MSAFIYLSLSGFLACYVRMGILPAASFRGLPGYLLALGLTLFLITWANFLIYVGIGWSPLYTPLSWAVLLGPLLYCIKTAPPSTVLLADLLSSLRAYRRWNYCFLFLMGFVLVRFLVCLATDADGHVWVNFNFVDAAFHLSVANCFLESPRFPPLDLNAAPYPLKYHFMADFLLAHVTRLGLPPITSSWLLNVIGASAMVGSLWAVLERWLRLPPRWIMLGGMIFLFMNQAILNLIQYCIFSPPYLVPKNPFDGVFSYPYYNFESILNNLMEPQRALVFATPVICLILHLAFECRHSHRSVRTSERTKHRILLAFALVCLLPLSHVVGFMVLCLSMTPLVLSQARWFFGQYKWWLPFFILGLLQLYYIQFYGPPANPAYSAWDVSNVLPLGEFSALPPLARRPAFWFFANGDFFIWGLLFVILAFWPVAAGMTRNPINARLRSLLLRWKYYFIVCCFFFILINFYRYSYMWGDSNKFVLFLNFGLTLAITLGSAQWIHGPHRLRSSVLWVFLFCLCLYVPSYDFYRKVGFFQKNNEMLFHRYDRAAAEWLRTSTPPSATVLTTAIMNKHFVTALGARPTPAGIYIYANPYGSADTTEDIRRIYEEGNVEILQKMQLDYVCVSNFEKSLYKISPFWSKGGQSGKALAFGTGDSTDFYSVRIFDVKRLLALRNAEEN